MRPSIRTHIVNLWSGLRYSYWFFPSIMAAGAVVLAFLMVAVDRLFGDGLVEDLSWVYAGGSDGAREVLAVIAGSMITVAGVVFSITVVALQLASSQFGPRVLRNFMRDRGNQFALGAFVSTFLYCLLVLRTIHGGEESLVPALSVSVGVLLAIGSLGVLIYYIHHASISIQAAHIVRRIGDEFFAAIQHVYPEKLGTGRSTEGPENEAIDDVFEGETAVKDVPAKGTGYVQRINDRALIRLAQKHDVVLSLGLGPGDFVREGRTLLKAAPADRLPESFDHSAREAFTLGETRTHEQDVLFAADQLVEVAVRSLSPGINDPFTAMSCIDWLGAGLARRMRRETPTPYRRDDDGELRIVARPVSLDHLLDHALNQIRFYASSHPPVLFKLIQTLELLEEDAADHEQRHLLRHHIDLVLDAGRRSLEDEEDRRMLEERAPSSATGA